jgi:very-short-patch-repair endonuclease
MEKTMFYGAGNKTFEYATQLRKNMTPTERILWKELRNRKIFKSKFRRQHPVGNFIVDFYCHEFKLVIEVDGEIHLDEIIMAHDAGRSQMLENLGLTVLRFSNEEVYTELEYVKKEILKHLM